MKNIRQHIYLAALLHDIGKFYQRADTGSVQTSRFLKAHCKEESSFCPQYNGRYSHKHVLWTAQFIDENRQLFQTLLPRQEGQLSDKESLIFLAAGHHLSAAQLSDAGRIIKRADTLSSGMDRDTPEARKDDPDEKGWDAFKKKRMVPLLQTIGQQPGADYWHLPIDPLSLSGSSFPRQTFDADPDYGSLWEKFVGEFRLIQARDGHAFSETLLCLLQKYTTCIPASTIHFSDVSLYDHMKTTAALAVCLYDVEQSGEQPETPFLLIGADLSGIQSYIYQIVSKYAGRNLKGRSFYLRLLSDAVVRYLLRELRLFQANVVYNSGGGFYLIAPNTSRVRERLEQATQQIEQHLFRAHHTSLFVAIDSIPLSEAALLHQGEHLGEVWGRLFEKRDRKKACKFARQITQDYDRFFSPSLSGGDTGRDTVTGEEFLPGETPLAEGDLEGLKKSTRDQIRLGKALRRSEIMVVCEEELPYAKDNILVHPAGLGFYYYFLSHSELAEATEKLKGSADRVSVITLNGPEGNCEFISASRGTGHIYGLEFYGGNEFNDQTFDEMCRNPEKFSRMGVLRMDVDNLGHIFRTGIAPERATLSRYAALSRSFDYFFSGYLNTIRREVSKERSFIVYSGGDDLFVVGRWDIVLEMASRIQQDFRRFACGNPAFSLSGGVAILPPKYPIMKGAEESGREEKRAKAHRCRGAAKNALSFLNTPLNWEMEYPVVAQLKEQLVVLLRGEEVLPRSFVSKILSHAANADIREHRICNVKTYWMVAYDLGRMTDRVKNEQARQLLRNCQTEVTGRKGVLNGQPIETDYHPLELWAFACRWAELQVRTDEEETH